jgi:S-DNA-T family DNA segregation ATPase FtsK/SpoIIIE
MAAVMEEKSALGLREVVLLVFSTCVLFMLIALVTFNNEDAGFSHSGSLQAVHNACGIVGAWISDFTLSLFGLMAYCLPIMLAWIGYLVYRDQLHTENNAVIIMRYIGFVITLAFGSALVYLHLQRIGVALPVGTGGILGQELGDFMVLMLGNSGATLFLLVGLLAGITLFTDLSWFGVMDAIGQYTLLVLRGFWQIFSGAKPAVSDSAPDQEVRLDEAQAPNSRQKKIAPVMDHTDRSGIDPLLSEGSRDVLDEFVASTPDRQEPRFTRKQEEVRSVNRPAPFQADKRMMTAVKGNAARVSEPVLGRQEPKFNNVRSSKSTDDRDVLLHDYPPVIDENFVDVALSAKVMGFEVNRARGFDEPGLSNYPPKLNDDDVDDERDYPAFSANRDVEVDDEQGVFNGLTPISRDEPRLSSASASAFNLTKKSERIEKLPTFAASALPQRNKVRFNKTADVLPDLSLLDERDTHVNGYTATDLEGMSRLVEAVLQDFNVVVDVVAVHPGPVITRFELQPAPGVKVSRISGLNKDIARALSVTSVRIVENIPGKSVIGLEIPNQEREMVTLRELLVSPAFKEAKSVLTLAMGKNIAGVPIVADLGKMPHALVAGTTGSGKSVAINTMILSLLYKATPEQVRLIMIDPKMLELSVYEGIPHLLTPVVTDMKEASNALRWAVAEMERRYKLMSKMGVRNIAGFNQLVTEAEARGQTIRDPLFQYDKPLGDTDEMPVLTTLPSIVIVIDELADMMMIVGKKVEELIARLAQKARAAGIHLILATQRPSVDVLTGLIKANVPTRISFQVSSRIDSRTILDQGGAETLLGNGDMLFLPSGTAIPIRAHGAFVDDHEVHRVVEFLKQTAPPNYLDDITREMSEAGDAYSTTTGEDAEADALYDQAVQFVIESRKASISSVQRKLKVGYNRAARMIETMEAAGLVSPAESNGNRDVLVPAVTRSDD